MLCCFECFLRVARLAHSLAASFSFILLHHRLLLPQREVRKLLLKMGQEDLPLSQAEVGFARDMHAQQAAKDKLKQTLDGVRNKMQALGLTGTHNKQAVAEAKDDTGVGRTAAREMRASLPPQLSQAVKKQLSATKDNMQQLKELTRSLEAVAI